MIAVKIEASFIAFRIIFVVYPDGKLGDILFVQTNRSVGSMPAVSAEMFFVNYPDAGNSIQQSSNLFAILANELAPVVLFVIIEVR